MAINGKTLISVTLQPVDRSISAQCSFEIDGLIIPPIGTDVVVGNVAILTAYGAKVKEVSWNPADQHVSIELEAIPFDDKSEMDRLVQALRAKGWDVC
jgi:hypothetical protein